MSEQGVDKGRRRFLTAATTAVGAVGAGFVAVPFIKNMMPSEAVKAASTTEVDLSKVEPGMQVMVLWQGKPVAIVNRTPAMLASLKKVTNTLVDPNSDQSEQPEYAKNEWRSRKPEYLVMLSICTHLGCVPLYKPEQGSVEPGWAGGYFCPCHGSKYDLAGRVLKNVPAPLNMTIPPYALFEGDKKVLIGKDVA
ncbi:ubiquinol-cytochrome c reductase iron-sulfur subunit [Thermithiobacillus plumbiphilus]|uniref:Ubiquinol-cytochrome c reductase iron-sulfur subunit n=1 Tax=Thermithiobacillus plumbiphilus TaxID=1729899 RepID=A0ABU9D898_9PROT